MLNHKNSPRQSEWRTEGKPIVVKNVFGYTNVSMFFICTKFLMLNLAPNRNFKNPFTGIKRI